MAEPIGGEPITGRLVPQESVQAPETPFQELAWSDPEYVEEPLGIDKREVVPPEAAVAEAAPPVPRGLTFFVPPGVAMLVVEARSYRQVVTVYEIGDAVLALFRYRQEQQVLDQMIVLNGNLPSVIPVHPGMELWVDHLTEVVQSMSFNIEPRGAGR